MRPVQISSGLVSIYTLIYSLIRCRKHIKKIQRLLFECCARALLLLIVSIGFYRTPNSIGFHSNFQYRNSFNQFTLMRNSFQKGVRSRSDVTQASFFDYNI